MLFDQLAEQSVHLEGTILKPNMISGTQHAHQADIAQVAELTLKCFHAHVPKAVPGIVFLSAGSR